MNYQCPVPTCQMIWSTVPTGKRVTGVQQLNAAGRPGFAPPKWNAPYRMCPDCERRHRV